MGLAIGLSGILCPRGKHSWTRVRQTVVSGRRCTFPRLGRDNGPASCEEREITNERERERGGESWYRTFCGEGESQSVPDSSLRSAVTTLQFPRKPILILAYMRVILSPHPSSSPIHLLRLSILLSPFIHQSTHSSSLCIPLCVRPSTLWSTLSLSPPFPSCGTYQRQGNLICSAVRRTLTELNVWFPFISVHLTNALPRTPPPFVSILVIDWFQSEGWEKRSGFFSC